MADEISNAGGTGDSSGGAAESGGESFMSQVAGEISGQGAGDAGSEGGAGDSGASFMSKIAGGASAQGQDEGAGDEKAEGEKADPDLTVVPEGPDGYGLSFGEETEVDEELLSGFTSAAHELGLNKGQAQKLATMYEKHMAAAEQKYQAEQAAALSQAKMAWLAEIQNRPTYKAEVEHVKHAFARFGAPELFDIMNQTHLGDHPVFWDFTVRIGKALGEPGFHGKTDGGGKEPPLIDRMWKDS